MLGPSFLVLGFIFLALALIHWGVPIWVAILIAAVALFLFGALFSND